MQVPGRLFPIQLKYTPPPVEVKPASDAPGQTHHAERNRHPHHQPAKNAREQERIDPAPYLRLLQQIDQTVAREEAGDLLVFLAGVDDITAVAEVHYR